MKQSENLSHYLAVINRFEHTKVFIGVHDEVLTADILIIIGTSMQVYPAASLKDYAKQNIPIIYIALIVIVL